jgi:hypothetical protein
VGGGGGRMEELLLSYFMLSTRGSNSQLVVYHDSFPNDGIIFHGVRIFSGRDLGMLLLGMCKMQQD